MDFSKVSNTMLDLVKASEFISPENIMKLKTMSLQKLAMIKAHSRGADVGMVERPNMFKIASALGSEIYETKARHELILKGISDYKDLK